MRYRIKLRGISPIIFHNGAAGLDVRSAANKEKAEIARKKGSNRTVADDERLQQLECQNALYLDPCGAPTMPAAGIRVTIEKGARKLKQGPQVREGMVIESVDEFLYDTERYGTNVERLSVTTQFTVPVVVQRNRVLRTRAKFDEWAVVFTIEVDDELIDESHLWQWLDIAGRRIGMFDWRPEKSGNFGRFETESIEALPAK